MGTTISSNNLSSRCSEPDYTDTYPLLRGSAPRPTIVSVRRSSKDPETWYITGKSTVHKKCRKESKVKDFTLKWVERSGVTNLRIIWLPDVVRTINWCIVETIFHIVCINWVTMFMDHSDVLLYNVK